MNKIKYLAVLLLPLVIYDSFSRGGLWTFFPLVFIFGIIPIIDAIIPPSSENKSEDEYETLKQDRTFDYMLYTMVLTQYIFMFYFLWTFKNHEGLWFEKLGIILSSGMMCGVLGINVAHELGHRTSKFEQFLSKALLLTSLYTHFFIEHNRGHHKNVSTDDDPASSKLGETVYEFWFRSGIFGYLSAWHLEKERLERKNTKVLSWENEMIRFQVYQIAAVLFVLVAFGWQTALAFVVAALVGGLLLETVNYIEHYGLRRNKNEKDRYEKVQPHHSWNSNHTVGRLFLFELSRHSDHHYIANRKYQILRHFDQSPQMPTGYPGMMVLSLVPPLWFWVMNKRVKNLNDLAD
jgi:alkane 1-monooxygenase